MALEVKFGFVCQRKFDELAGEGDLRRFCDTCQTEVVNLDALDEEARLRLFEEAAMTGDMPCVSATTEVEGGRGCVGGKAPTPPEPIMTRTAGLPAMPTNLKEERERLDRLRAQRSGPRRGLLSRLKFW